MPCFIRLICLLSCLPFLLQAPTACPGAEAANLQLRRQVPVGEHDESFRAVIDQQSWELSKTAVIVCDMWDSHHCFRAVGRVNELAPRVDRLLKHVRKAGGTIIHAPSGCMESYADHPARRRALAESIVANLPDQIESWCYKIDAESENSYPIDQSDGGEDDSPEEHASWEAELVKQGRDPKRPWRKQIDRIEIDPRRDFVSDRGDEIWSLLANRSIDQVMLVGVHTNMCVLGRPFGLRQLAKNGKNVVLVRDLTDTMYNPAARPYVSHFTGTDLIVSYIERYVCPTISSDQLLGGSPLRFKDDERPTIVMMVGESEYNTEQTLPIFAIKNLGKAYRVRFVLEHPDSKKGFVGLEQLEDADALLISVRRKLLPKGQLVKVRRYVASGKPVIGIRTASHAFCLRKAAPPPGRSDWKTFDPDVFGGHYTNHHGNQLASTVHAVADSQSHPILKGVKGLPFQQGGSLYKTSPLLTGTNVLLVGKADGVRDEPVAWTFERSDGGVSFYTSLGHKDDFEQPVFEKLLKQAIDWSLQISESQ